MTIFWRVACWISETTRAQAQARACGPTHKHVRMHMHASTRAHIHTRKCVITIAFSRQNWYLKHASILHYTYIVSFVKKVNQ
jgi:hypothetical protein